MLRTAGLLTVSIASVLMCWPATAQDSSGERRSPRIVLPKAVERVVREADAAISQRDASPSRESSRRDTSQPAPAERRPSRVNRLRDAVRAHNPDALQVADTLKALGARSPFDYSSDGQFLVAALADGGGLALWEPSTRRRLHRLENSDRRYTLVAISDAGDWIAAVRAEDQDQIDLWRADSGRYLRAMQANGGPKRTLEFVGANRLNVVAAGGDGTQFSIPSGVPIGGSRTLHGGSAARTPTRDFGEIKSALPAAPKQSDEAPRTEPPVSSRRRTPSIAEEAAPARSRLETEPTPTPAPKIETERPRAATIAPRAPATAQPAAPEPVRKSFKYAPSAPAVAAPRAPESSIPDEPAFAPAPQPTIVAPPQPTIAAPSEPAFAEPNEPAAAAPAAPGDSAPYEPSGGAAPEPEFEPAPAPAAAEPAREFREFRYEMREEPAAEESAPAASPPAADAILAPADEEPSAAAEPSEAAEAVEEAVEPTEEAEPAGEPVEPSASSPSAEKPPVTSVTIHYATNRNRLAAKDREWSVYFVGFFGSLPAFVIYGLVILALLVLPWFGKRSWAVSALLVGGVLLCGMGLVEAYVRSQLRDEMTGELYGCRPTVLSYGACEISVPPPQNRRPGDLSRPVSVWVFEAPENPEKHFMLRRVDEYEDKDAFYGSLGAQLDKSDAKAALLFIHGYNVSFEDAVFRTAQLAVDLKFPGAPVVFCWPSFADPVKYTFDEQNAEVSIPALREVLQDLCTRSGAKSIHVIAHSMGNRVLAGALETMDYESQARTKEVLRELVLAAPDIDSRVFQSQVLPHIVRSTQHCTLYASSRDRALLMSHCFHNFQRLGETQPELLVAQGLDTIDASFVDTSLLGHSYIGDVQSIVSDLHDLVVRGKRPMERLGLQVLERNALPYWSIVPQVQTATTRSR